RVADEELGEPVLRQQDRPRERVVVEPDRAPDQLVRGRDLVRALAGLLPRVTLRALEEDLRDALRARASRDAVARAVDRELEQHGHRRLPLADELLDPL